MPAQTHPVLLRVLSEIPEINMCVRQYECLTYNEFTCSVNSFPLLGKTDLARENKPCRSKERSCMARGGTYLQESWVFGWNEHMSLLPPQCLLCPGTSCVLACY